MSDLPEIVNATTLAKVLGINVRRVQQLFNEGVVVKVSRGKYELLPSVHNYISMKEAAANKDKDGDGYSDPIKNLKYKKDLLEYEERAGIMVNKQDLAIKFAGAGILLKKNILALIPRVKAKLAAETDTKKITEILESEIVVALRSLKDGMPD